jgi:hypothetical protein
MMVIDDQSADAWQNRLRTRAHVEHDQRAWVQRCDAGPHRWVVNVFAASDRKR